MPSVERDYMSMADISEPLRRLELRSSHEIDDQSNNENCSENAAAEIRKFLQWADLKSDWTTNRMSLSVRQRTDGQRPTRWLFEVFPILECRHDSHFTFRIAGAVSDEGFTQQWRKNTR